MPKYWLFEQKRAVGFMIWRLWVCYYSCCSQSTLLKASHMGKSYTQQQTLANWSFLYYLIMSLPYPTSTALWKLINPICSTLARNSLSYSHAMQSITYKPTTHCTNMQSEVLQQGLRFRWSDVSYWRNKGITDNSGLFVCGKWCRKFLNTT